MAKRQLPTNDGPAGKLQRLTDAAIQTADAVMPDIPAMQNADAIPEEIEVDEPYHIEESIDRMPRKYGYEEKKFRVKFH